MQTRHQFKNGLTVLYLHTKNDPVSACHLFLTQGSAHESHDKNGITTLMWALSSKGTVKRSARQCAEDIESMGAYIGAGASHDYSEVSCHAISEHFLKTLEIMSEILLTPAFLESETEKEKKALQAAIRSKKESIFTVTQESLNLHLYKDHPYARAATGTEETVAKLTAQDLKAWHDELAIPEGALLSIASDHDVSVILPHLERLFGPQVWSPKKKSTLKSIGKPAVLSDSLFHKNQTNFEQAFLMLGFSAPDILSADYVPLKILGGILGGGMSARLFQNLREKEGLAYDVGAYYPTRKNGSGFLIYMGLQFSRMQEAKKRILQELEILQKEPVPKLEFEQAVNYLKGTFILDHQTNSQRAHYQGWWEILGLPADFDKKYSDLMSAETNEHIFAVAKRIFANPFVTIETHPKNA